MGYHEEHMPTTNSKKSELRDCVEECDDQKCVDDCLDEFGGVGNSWQPVDNSNPEGINQYTGVAVAHSKVAHDATKKTLKESQAKLDKINKENMPGLKDLDKWNKSALESAKRGSKGFYSSAASRHEHVAYMHDQIGEKATADLHRTAAEAHRVAHEESKRVRNAGINQPRCPELGQYLNTGAGTGRGEPHRAARKGHKTLIQAEGDDVGSPTAMMNRMAGNKGDCGCGGRGVCTCEDKWMPMS